MQKLKNSAVKIKSTVVLLNFLPPAVTFRELSKTAKMLGCRTEVDGMIDFQTVVLWYSRKL
jgi:hypothetical protein